MSDQVADAGDVPAEGWVAPDNHRFRPGDHPEGLRPAVPQHAARPDPRLRSWPMAPPAAAPAWDPHGPQRPGWDPSGRTAGWIPAPQGQPGGYRGYRPPRQVARPRYREPLPVRPSRVTLGFVGGLVWMALVGAQPVSFSGYIWATLVGGVLSWAAAVVLAKVGDRGVAAGVAAASAAGVAIATVMIVIRWVDGGWPLW
ncbi:MAG: hypothetical protein JXA67_08995 [Micromonosporaceae bacterium]|nr:hypothetical protein [Micromonosporaceae bacterium]